MFGDELAHKIKIPLLYDYFKESIICDLVQFKRFPLLDVMMEFNTCSSLIKTLNDFDYIQTISRTPVVNFFDKFEETQHTEMIDSLMFPSG